MHIFTSHSPEKPKLALHIDLCMFIIWLSRTHSVVLLFSFHIKAGRLNPIKLCTKMADVPRSNLGLMPFQLFHRFKMTDVSMTSLPQSLRRFIFSIIIIRYGKIYVLIFGLWPKFEDGRFANKFEARPRAETGVSKRVRESRSFFIRVEITDYFHYFHNILIIFFRRNNQLY